MQFKSKLFTELNKMGSKYGLVSEADETDMDEIPAPETAEDPTMADDATMAPQQDELPDNTDGNYISDTKLAMFAQTLIRAYMAKPSEEIPADYLNVTTQNANEVIKYVEDSLKAESSTPDIVKDLSTLT